MHRLFSIFIMITLPIVLSFGCSKKPFEQAVQSSGNIAFITSRYGNSLEVALLDPITKNVARLTYTNSGNNYYPAWSPDRKKSHSTRIEMEIENFI